MGLSGRRRAIERDGGRIIGTRRSADGLMTLLVRLPDGTDWMYFPDEYAGITGECARSVALDNKIREGK